ncbi:histidine kinase [Gordonibacter sp. An230]|uniref:sensor histidine kinase n=1 Tax=Gordonibacter sp. An230 TaxID=1965592 RepID=UPI000B3AC184|nr:sensor histidine kinase [Gordonibacter sp. An230]OUO90760.1 histidine kinase [Gordonibacter sp. An230]
MTPRAYLRDRAFVLIAIASASLFSGGVLAALGQGWQAAALVAGVVAGCGAAALAFGYFRARRFWRELACFSDGLVRAWYAPSLMEEPGFLEGRLAYEALEAHAKAASDEVAAHKGQAEAYRGYVELWIHEIKTPIAAAGLIAAGMHGPQAERMKGELDRIEGYVEQALYYARSTSLSRDFSIRETSLADVVRGVARKHARYLVEQKTMPVFDVSADVRVWADAKWLAFALGQLVTNAAKYGAASVRFSACEEGEGTAEARTVLEVADDGPGIPSEDVPRVFERGFTGRNGRALGSSTGMGLYLVAELCEKMGLGVALASEEGRGTRVLISFPHDRRRLDAQAGIPT